MIRTQYYHYSWREHVTSTEIHKVNPTLTKFPSVPGGRGHSIPELASTSGHGLHFLCNGNTKETPVKWPEQKRKHDDGRAGLGDGCKILVTTAGRPHVELVVTNGGGPRRQARAGLGPHWCRARAAADLLGRRERLHTKAAGAGGVARGRHQCWWRVPTQINMVLILCHSSNLYNHEFYSWTTFFSHTSW
jgi:hypothetical protein